MQHFGTDHLRGICSCLRCRRIVRFVFRRFEPLSPSLRSYFVSVLRYHRVGGSVELVFDTNHPADCAGAHWCF